MPSEMKPVQESQQTPEIQSTPPVSHDSQSEQQNNNSSEAHPDQDSGPDSVSDKEQKISREDIELVQNLIERCLQLYMNQDEVVKTLLNRARIDPGFTTLVWQKLEEQNPEFFRAYYIRLKLKKQISLFNHLLEYQCHMMKYPAPPKAPSAPIQSAMHTVPVNNVPMGYPILQPPPIPIAGQPYLTSMGNGISSCHVVNGVPGPGSCQPMRTNAGNGMGMTTSPVEAVPESPPSGGTTAPMAAMPISPTTVASSGHFLFSSSELPMMEVDTSALDAAFKADMSQIPWNFSLSDLTADLTNLADLGALGNYAGSAFIPPDSDLLLDSPGQEDMVDEYFVDSVPGTPAQSDEEKP